VDKKPFFQPWWNNAISGKKKEQDIKNNYIFYSLPACFQESHYSMKARFG
jgi:hypothetical protein